MRKMQNSEDRVIYVTIPAYNCERYLENSVESVLSQTNINVRVVIVDDGSTDKTPHMIDIMSGRDKRICAIHEKNRGVSSARNAGIEHVLSVAGIQDYIAFLDADDAWKSDFFDQTILERLNGGADLIGFQAAVCNSGLTKCIQPIDLKEGEYTGGNKSVWLHATQHFAAMLYSCGFLKRYFIRFMEGLKYSEDKIFSMQCMYLAGKIILVNRVLHLYRQNDNSAMKARKFGIPYYVPIIEAYVKSDAQMQKYKNPERGELDQGNVMAGIYVMDMLAEHFQKSGCVGEVNKLFENKPLFREIYDRELKNKNPRYVEYETKKGLFIIRNRIQGICSSLIAGMAKVKIVNRFKQEIRFSMEIEKI